MNLIDISSLFDTKTFSVVITILFTIFAREIVALIFKERKERKAIVSYLLFFTSNLKDNIDQDYIEATHVRLDNLQDKFIDIQKINNLELVLKDILNIYNNWRKYNYYLKTHLTSDEKDIIILYQENIEKELDEIIAKLQTYQ